MSLVPLAHSTVSLQLVRLAMWSQQVRLRELWLLKAQRQGHAEGHAEGQRQKALDIARALLDVLDLDTIAAKTGLSIDELQQVRNEAALSKPGEGD